MQEIQGKHESIGQVLRAIRETQGLTRRSVARQCGMSTQGIWYLEANSDSHFQTVRKVCRVLKVSMDEVSKLLPNFIPHPAPPIVHVGRPSSNRVRKSRKKPTAF